MNVSSCGEPGQGELSAYDDLVRRYQERVYATIYHMTSNHEDANDLAQETFIKAYHALKSFKGDSSFFHVALSDCGEQDHQSFEATET
jgi:DNA-directed RNA polymerase specialized sigma24 family protein